jgi:O-acetyl-ADP-ribose deacetylase (regulator of RNase III)
MPGSCFVISPIGERDTPVRRHADAVFERLIAPAMRAVDMTATRADHVDVPGRISEQMFRAILQDDLCIAVLTFSNPNVFYEVAVAQCNQRPLILLLREGDRVPFDTSDYRVVQYPRQLKGKGVPLAVDDIVDQIRAVQAGTWTPPKVYGDLRPFSWLTAADVQKLVETSRPKVLAPEVVAAYRLKTFPDRRLVILAGNLRDHLRRGVDVIVSSENVDLQLARYYEPSLSGVLRYLDATRRGGRVIRDNLALAVEKAAGDTPLPVAPGFVLATPTTVLADEYKIKFIFHAAVVQGVVESGYSPIAEAIPEAVKESYREFVRLAADHALTSMLFPLLGAGSAKLDAAQAAALMIPATVQGMRDADSCKTTFIVARVQSHASALIDAMRARPELEVAP